MATNAYPRLCSYCSGVIRPRQKVHRFTERRGSFPPATRELHARWADCQAAHSHEDLVYARTLGPSMDGVRHYPAAVST